MLLSLTQLSILYNHNANYIIIYKLILVYRDVIARKKNFTSKNDRVSDQDLIKSSKGGTDCAYLLKNTEIIITLAIP